MVEYEALSLTGHVTTQPLEPVVHAIVRGRLWNQELLVNRRVPQCHHDKVEVIVYLNAIQNLLPQYLQWGIKILLQA